MTIHNTERVDYAIRRGAIYLTGLTVTGSPIWHVQGFERPITSDSDPIARLTFEPLPGRVQGYVSASQTAIEQSLQVVIDLFWPTSRPAYQVDQAASELYYELRELRLSFREYGTPASPTDVTGYFLRVVDPPSILRLPSADHNDRRRVIAVFRWLSAHS